MKWTAEEERALMDVVNASTPLMKNGWDLRAQICGPEATRFAVEPVRRAGGRAGGRACSRRRERLGGL